MELPIELNYSKDHVWVAINGDFPAIGITDHAQESLGEIVYVDLPIIGSNFQKDQVFGSIEAIKTTSDLVTPLTGEVVEVNKSVSDNPILVNTSPYLDGWIIKMKMAKPDELTELMDFHEYKQLII